MDYEKKHNEDIAMTTEEKAKAYDEALERAKKSLRAAGDVGTNIVTFIFPELRESEDEDEQIRKELIAILKKSYNSGITLNNKKDLDRYLAYLEKQKEQKPTEGKEYSSPECGTTADVWSEEDQKSLNRAINICINDFDEDSETARFLKSLPERFALQPKQEWSEEDEKMRLACIDIIEHFPIPSGTVVYGPWGDCINWLKSLKNRGNSPESNTNSPWKPSVEQMESLCQTIIQTKGYSYSMYLPELYEQLKKL